MDAHLSGGAMPTCRAGRRAFNVDHMGNVSPCIEKIDEAVGNIREEPLAAILSRLARVESVSRCQECWTLCRACCQFMRVEAGPRNWWDMATRMRSW